MLKLITEGKTEVLNVDDFYIKEKADGLDELVFNISIYDKAYPDILEEAAIEYDQRYLIKAIDAGSSTAKVKCQLDVDAFKEKMYLKYTNGSATLIETIGTVLPTDWQVLDESGSTIRRTIEGDYTALDVLDKCRDTYNVAFRFDNKLKQLKAIDVSKKEPLGAFASRELNLKEINYKGKSTDLYTRLYAYGKNGLSFADINDGKPYVECLKYTDKIISRYWKDDRYEQAENLKEAAQKAVDAAAIPERSYECSVYDLAQTNPEMYSFQDFGLFNIVTLIDDIKNISINYQVVEYLKYPFYPEKNTVTLSSVAPKIQNSVKNIITQIENPNSQFRTNIQNLINELGNQISGQNGGNMVITQNEQGQPNGIMIMDTPDKATAKKVLWFNLSGIAYSDTGVNGNYSAVWSFEEGGFIADWLVAGTINAINIIGSFIKGSTLQFGSDENKTVKVYGNNTGVTFQGNGNINMSTQGMFDLINYVAGSNYSTISNRIYATDSDKSNGVWLLNRNTDTQKEANRIHIYKNKNGGSSGFELLNYSDDSKLANIIVMKSGDANSIDISNLDKSGKMANQIYMESGNANKIGFFQFDSAGYPEANVNITNNEAQIGHGDSCYMHFNNDGYIYIKVGGEGAYKCGFVDINGHKVLAAL